MAHAHGLMVTMHGPYAHMVMVTMHGPWSMVTMQGECLAHGDDAWPMFATARQPLFWTHAVLTADVRSPKERPDKGLRNAT